MQSAPGAVQQLSWGDEVAAQLRPRPVQFPSTRRCHSGSMLTDRGVLCLNAQLLEVDCDCCGAQRLEAAAAAAVSVTALHRWAMK